MAADDVLDADLCEHLRVLRRAHAMDMYLISCDLLALLEQDRQDAHDHAASKRHQQHAHRAKSFVVPAVLLVYIERDVMPGVIIDLELPFRSPVPSYVHFCSHDVLLLCWCLPGDRKGRLMDINLRRVSRIP